MIIKEIIVSCSLSKKFNSHKCEETIIIEPGDDIGAEKRKAGIRCRNFCLNEIGMD